MVGAYWTVSFNLPQAAAETAQQAFDELAMSVSGFEVDEKNHLWTFQLLCTEKPDTKEIERRLMVLSKLYDVSAPELTYGQLEQQDWLKQVATQFPPLSIGRFYVHGTHVTEPPPPGAIPIRVDAGGAFGSGEHGTTRGCLEAFEWLSKRHDFRKILDMGCGSAILAIAAAKLWRSDVIASDIDPIAVQVSEQNIHMNRVTSHVTALVSDGYANDRIRRAGPFELIVSNILARPLVRFAPDLKSHLAEGGVAVLSGLLTSQEAYVRAAHDAQGLKLSKRILHGDWCTLVLE